MRCLRMLCHSFQITRNHYQNALTATRMDSSPQTPDAESHAPGERMTIPETRSNSIALPLTEPRPCLTRLHQHSHLYRQPDSTTTLNERNRIVRECIRFSFTASLLGSLVRLSGSKWILKQFDKKALKYISSGARKPLKKLYMTDRLSSFPKASDLFWGWQRLHNHNVKPLFEKHQKSCFISLNTRNKHDISMSVIVIYVESEDADNACWWYMWWNLDVSHSFQVQDKTDGWTLILLLKLIRLCVKRFNSDS